ncbi:MAG: AbrB/MazE/SpoVT family DNA-binding domain-containing protein [Candidatus Limnocylindria bacterium]
MPREVVESTQVDRQGRVVVPARVRAAAGLVPGTPVAARASRGRVILESLDAIEQKLWRAARLGLEGDATTTLLADRRREVSQETDR